MKEISEFYHQVSLLLESDLPLPESFPLMLESYKISSPEFDKINQDIQNGLSLSAILEKHPVKFPAEHISMIRVAESNDTLNETLHELAQYSRLQFLITRRVKDVMLYPLIVFSLILVVFGVITKFCVIPFKKVYDDLLDGEPLPGMTENVISISVWITDNYLVYWTLSFLFISFLFGLYQGFIKIPFLKVVGFHFISLFSSLPSALDSSKLCSYMSLQLQHSSDFPSTCHASANLVNSPWLKQEMKEAAVRMNNGEPCNDVLSGMLIMNPLIVQSLVNSRTDKIPKELDRLAEYFHERIYRISENLIMYWQVILLSLLGVLSIGVVIALLQPFMSIGSHM